MINTVYLGFAVIAFGDILPYIRKVYLWTASPIRLFFRTMLLSYFPIHTCYVPRLLCVYWGTHVRNLSLNLRFLQLPSMNKITAVGMYSIFYWVSFNLRKEYNLRLLWNKIYTDDIFCDLKQDSNLKYNLFIMYFAYAPYGVHLSTDDQFISPCQSFVRLMGLWLCHFTLTVARYVSWHWHKASAKVWLIPNVFGR